MTLTEAVASDAGFMAIPFGAVEAFGNALPDWNGKIVVDTTNAHRTPNAGDNLKGRLSSQYAAEVLPGAQTVNAFNRPPARTLAAEVPSGQGRRVVFVSSDSGETDSQIAELARTLGLSAVELGGVAEGGRLRRRTPHPGSRRTGTQEPHRKAAHLSGRVPPPTGGTAGPDGPSRLSVRRHRPHRGGRRPARGQVAAPQRSPSMRRHFSNAHA